MYFKHISIPANSFIFSISLRRGNVVCSFLYGCKTLQDTVSKIYALAQKYSENKQIEIFKYFCASTKMDDA